MSTAAPTSVLIFRNIIPPISAARRRGCLGRRFGSPQLWQHINKMRAPRAPVVASITADVIVVRAAVLLQNLVKHDASVRRLIFVSAKADEEVVHLLIDRRVAQELRRALFGIRISRAEDAERRKQIE